MSSAENAQPPGVEVVVAEDGSIPAETLAKYGFRPGSHLRLVSEPTSEQPRKRKSIMGILEGKIDVEAFEEGMAWGKQDRINQVMREDETQ